jgi:hypothetical protein
MKNSINYNYWDKREYSGNSTNHLNKKNNYLIDEKKFKELISDLIELSAEDPKLALILEKFNLL